MKVSVPFHPVSMLKVFKWTSGLWSGSGFTIMPTKRDAGDTSTFSDSEMIRNDVGDRKQLLQEIFSVPPGTYPELDGHYILHQTIGTGGSAKVKVATDLITGEKVAVKIIEKAGKEVEMHRVAREITTLLTIKHSHICKLLRVIHSEKAILLIMEYCPMDLHDFIRNSRLRLSENEARRIFIQLMSAVACLHELGIAHRDLKPENVLLDFNNNIKLADFGLCAVASKSTINKALLKTPCGSPAYCAPELLKGHMYSGSKVDVWSLGVILYVLLCSQLPFQSKNIKDLYKKIQDLDYVIPDWVPSGARDLIESILQGNVKLRPSLYQLWFHPWIQQSGVLLDSYQDQITLAEKAIKDEYERCNLVGEVPRSRLTYSTRSPTVIGYMDDPDHEPSSTPSKNSEKSRFTVTLVNPDTDKITHVHSSTTRVKNGTDSPNKTSRDGTKLSKIFSRLRKLTRSCIPKRMRNESSSSKTNEPRELKWTSINSDIKMASLTIVDEEFADCILDKLQQGLQALGIPSERIGSTVKHGITSPCKFEFEVMSLEGLNQLCVQRKYIRAKDPTIVKKIIQHVLLMSSNANQYSDLAGL